MLFNFYNQFYTDAVLSNDVNRLLQLERLVANVRIDKQWRQDRERAEAKESLSLPAGNLPTIESV